MEAATLALKQFLEVQTCRAQLYTRFQEGFKAFLRTKQEGQYKALMAELTASFNDCSRRVIALEAALKETGRADLAATLRIVQESERDKLRLTLTLQALQQAAAFRSFSWQQQQHKHGGSGGGADALYDEDDDEALALLDPHFTAASRGGCAHGHGHKHDEAHGSTHVHGAAEAPAATAADGNGTGSEAAGPGPCVPGSCDAQLANGGSCGGAPHGAGGGHSGGPEVGSSGGGGCGSEAAGDGSVNVGGAAAASAAPSHGGATEPTRREFEAAVKEAMQGLDACIRRINEAIDEVRMELEDDCLAAAAGGGGEGVRA